MFRKIRSNRNPRDTLYSELKKEFGPYHASFRAKLQKIAQEYPRFLFALMCINITLSVILVVSLRQAPPAKHTPIKPPNIGFDRLLQTGEALRETILLKRQVDSIMAKKQLTKQDSATLEKALDQLQTMKKQNP